MTYYTREITMPTTRKEGLSNYVQMIVNQIEAGDTREALLTAVNLLDDLSGGAYDGVTTDVAPDTISTVEHYREISNARGEAWGDGFSAGQKAKAAELRAIFSDA